MKNSLVKFTVRIDFVCFCSTEITRDQNIRAETLKKGIKGMTNQVAVFLIYASKPVTKQSLSDDT